VSAQAMSAQAIGATEDERAQRRKDIERDAKTERPKNGNLIHISNDENRERDRTTIYSLMCNE